MIGSQAAFAFDLSADFGLLVAAVVGFSLFAQSKDSSGKLKKGYLEN
jgi:hypothetical protein